MKYVLVLLTLCAALAQAKPVIRTAGGAHGLAAVADSSVLARGAVFAVEGAGLGPADVVANSTPYGTDAGGTSVALTTADGSTTVQAYVVQAGANLILAILPSTTPSGDYNVAVTFNGETSDPVKVKVADRSFGAVTINGKPGGPATARVRVPDSDSVAVTYVASAKPGQTLDIDAAGLGAIDGADNDYPAEANMVDGAVLSVAGQEIPISYLGRNAQRPGYDRIVATLPDSGLPSGCSVEFRVRIGDIMSSAFTLPLTPAGQDVCTHPLGISNDGLAKLAGGDTIVLPSFIVSQQTISMTIMGFSIDTKSESANGAFARYSAKDLADFMGSNTTANYVLGANSCTIFTTSDVTGPIGTALDAGAKLNLTGPDSLNKDLARGDGNSYSATLSTPGTGIPGIPGIPGLPGAGSSALKKGTFNLSGTGGADVGPFTASLQASDSIVWSNKSSVTAVDRSKDLTLLWTNGVTGDIVDAVGLAQGPAPEDTTKIVARMFVCTAPAEAGKIVVPSDILKQMPAVKAPSVDSKAEEVGTVGLLQTGGLGTPRFQAPLVAGGNTESGVFTFSYFWMVALAYQ